MLPPQRQGHYESAPEASQVPDFSSLSSCEEDGDSSGGLGTRCALEALKGNAFKKRQTEDIFVKPAEPGLSHPQTQLVVLAAECVCTLEQLPSSTVPVMCQYEVALGTTFFKRQVTVVLVLTCALGLVLEISQGFQWTGQAGKQILLVNLYFFVPAGIFSTNQPVRHLFHLLSSSGLGFLGRCSLAIGMAPVKSKKEMKFKKEMKYSSSKSLSQWI
ncbi:hypothetical protein EK904_008884 [Melospiza melodia maxima]|nr:hypothetical protein EK904_008884 [Melospiza melodia maxima]